MFITTPHFNRLETKIYPKPRFQGAYGMSSFAGLTGEVDRTFRWMGANRTREMLVEDFVGFGLLRSGMDLFRGYFFGEQEALNIPAARERLFREVSSIMTDSVAAGLAALGLARLLDRPGASFGAKFVDFKTMTLFQEVLEQGDAAKSEATFLKQLARRLAAAESQVINAPVIASKLNLIQGKNASEKATELAKVLGKKELDVMIRGQVFRLDELFEDVAILKAEVEKAVGIRGTWGEKAQGLVLKTLKTKNKLLWCLGVGAGLTMAVPKVNQWLTREIDHIEAYPGERGRVSLKDRDSLEEALPMVSSGRLKVGNTFSGFVSERKAVQTMAQNPKSSFVSRSLEEGKQWPLLLALSPLPFAVGLFDTVNRRFVNPLAKGFVAQWKNRYDFGKKLPFTTQQQIASTFAVLIMARLFNARSENEYRERLVDSVLGWGLWVLATPYIKEKAANVMDQLTGSMLLKRINGRYALRSRAEIEHLLPARLVNKTLKKNIWIGAVSTMATMALLGVIEPYLAIQWTKRNTVSATAV